MRTRQLATVRHKNNLSCFIDGCRNKSTFHSRVRLLEELDDYEINVRLCARHRTSFKKRSFLLQLDLKSYGNETLLDETKDGQERVVKETLDYIRWQAKENNNERSAQLIIDAAQHFAKVGDCKFMFGFYCGQLFTYSSFRNVFRIDATRERRAEEVRKRMALRDLYPNREHPDTSRDLIDICRCGHERFMHSSVGTPPGECYVCLCPVYEFEQRLTRHEISDVHSLMHQELRKR